MNQKITDYVERRKTEIAERIRSARSERGLTQQQVANWLGCSRRRLNRVEQGDIELTIGEVEMLTRLFEKPMSYFFQEPDWAPNPAFAS